MTATGFSIDEYALINEADFDYVLARSLTMKQTTVQVSALLDALKKNREKHKQTYTRALEVFRERCIKDLDCALQAARNGGPTRLSINLPVPEDHTDDYDRAIQMLEMGTETVVTITAHEFDTYVRDRWSWFDSFNRTTNSYANKA